MYSQDSQLKKVQERTLKIAKTIADFCQKHNLLCYLCGGGAIGAIREKGFVPWDDDLDFFMPRKDYERFCQLWQMEKPKGYVLERTSQHFINHNNFTTIRDPETTFVKTYQINLDIVHGITVDVFPLDRAPIGKFQQKRQKLWALIYALFNEQIVPVSHGGLVTGGSRLLLSTFRSPNQRYHIWKYAEKQMMRYDDKNTPWVTELCVGPKYMGNRYPTEDFASAVWLPFEDVKLPVPVGYDRYLRHVFGDYMRRPKVSQQVPHHDAVFVDPDTPYTKYRGIYYLTKGEK